MYGSRGKFFSEFQIESWVKSTPPPAELRLSFGATRREEHVVSRISGNVWNNNGLLEQKFKNYKFN